MLNIAYEMKCFTHIVLTLIYTVANYNANMGNTSNEEDDNVGVLLVKVGHQDYLNYRRKK